MEEKEKLENKENCCDDKSCEGCHNCHSMMHGCHHWKKCHIIRKIIMIVVVILAFCFGVQWGEMRSGLRGDYRFERGGMMNWGYGPQLNSRWNDTITPTTGTVTVDVSKTPETPKQ